jgi:hypothetical protein
MSEVENEDISNIPVNDSDRWEYSKERSIESDVWDELCTKHDQQYDKPSRFTSLALAR